MGHNNARFYCLEHPDRLGKGYCKECKSTMCSSCLEADENFCPACRRELFLNSDKNVSRNSVLVPLIGGALGFYFGYSRYQSQTAADAWEEPYLMILYLTLLGISLFYSFFLFRNNDVFDDVANIPFIGLKVKLALYVLSVASAIPAVLYLYNAVVYLASSKQRKI